MRTGNQCSTWHVPATWRKHELRKTEHKETYGPVRLPHHLCALLPPHSNSSSPLLTPFLFLGKFPSVPFLLSANTPTPLLHFPSYPHMHSLPHRCSTLPISVLTNLFHPSLHHSVSFHSSHSIFPSPLLYPKPVLGDVPSHGFFLQP